MPKGRKSQKLSQSSSVDYGESSQSQQSTRGGDQLSAEDETRLAAAVVRYLLVAHGRGSVIAIADLKRLVPDHHWHAHKQILAVAKRQLEHVFGLSLQHLEKREMTVVNQLPVEQNQPHVVLADAEEQRRGLLVVILSLIFMNNAPVKEGLLWSFLKSLEIDVKERHACFGNVKKLITQELVRARFLRTEKVKDGDSTVLEFHWGERALKEIKQLDILQFVCSVSSDVMRPQMWPEQYKRATSE